MLTQVKRKMVPNQWRNDDWVFVYYIVGCVWYEGKGLTLMVSSLEGDHTQRHHDAETARSAILSVMKKEKAKGFAEVIVARNTLDGIGYLWVDSLCTRLTANHGSFLLDSHKYLGPALANWAAACYDLLP